MIFRKKNAQKKTKIFSFFRGRKRKKKPLPSELIGVAQYGSHGYYFLRQKKEIFIVSRKTKNLYVEAITLPKKLMKHVKKLNHLHAIHLGKNEYGLIVTYPAHQGYKIHYLISDDGVKFNSVAEVKTKEGNPVRLVRMQDESVALLTSIEGEICYCDVSDFKDELKYHKTQLGPRDDSFDHAPLKVAGVKDLDEGIFVLYEASYQFEGYQTHRFGGALLAHDNLGHVHWRAFSDETPFWDHFISRQDACIELTTMGTFFHDQEIEIVFYDQDEGDIYSVELHQPYTRKHVNPHKAHLRKYINNPILRPIPEHNWECHTVLNPGAIEIDGITHLLYRAEGSAGLSVIGYGKSYNGVAFDRLPDPVYVPRMHFEGVNVPADIRKYGVRGAFKSGYNHYPCVSGDKVPEWHGVEDPRVTEMDGRIYMIYAAYNGYQMARPAITSIDKNDFLNHHWDWSTPQPMTPVAQYHGQGNKNVVLHPEKVGGKYMLYQRIWPHIQIDFVDDLEFGPGKKYLKEMARIPARGDSWDSHKVAVAAPPILIDEGWLLIYQGAGSQDRRYKVGAMILDREDPTKVLYRSNQPILEPSEWYENEHKFGVAYPCGATVKNDTLHVYYGGSDKYVCVAQAPLREFVDKLKLDPYNEPQLKKESNATELCT